MAPLILFLARGSEFVGLTRWLCAVVIELAKARDNDIIYDAKIY